MGQVLYPGAEAEGIRAAGIGCFLDDEMHALPGLTGQAFQTLHHFTAGGFLEDPRLRTSAPYQHRDATEPYNRTLLT